MDKWKKAVEILKNGGVVIIPSDSSYGIAALASSPDAVGKVYKIKGREAGKPSLLIVGSTEQAHELVEFTPLADELAQKYWPGGLSLVLDAKSTDLPEQIYGADHTLTLHLGGGVVNPSGSHLPGELTLAVRLPDKRQLRDLALKVGPFILPSANLAGEKPPFSAGEVDKKIINQVDFFLDEPTGGNPSSTIVDARGEKPKILRDGPVKVAEKS